MKQFDALQKHEILLEYVPRSATHSFSALAVRHSVAGGGEVIRRWHQRWDGTASSLYHRKGAGRPRILTHAQVKRHIAPRIRSKNRSHIPVVYPQLLPLVTAATEKSMSLRTMERYGKVDLLAQPIHGKKRTAEECE